MPSKPSPKRAAAPTSAADDRAAVSELLAANQDILTDALVEALADCPLEVVQVFLQAMKSQPASALTPNQALMAAKASAAAIKKVADAAEVKILCASPDAKRLPKNVQTALRYLRSPAAVKAVIAKAKKAGSTGSPLAEVRAAKSGSSLRDVAEKMHVVRPRGGTRTPSEARAAKAARGER